MGSLRWQVVAAEGNGLIDGSFREAGSSRKEKHFGLWVAASDFGRPRFLKCLSLFPSRQSPRSELPAFGCVVGDAKAAPPWVGIDADTKLAVTWHVGGRNAVCAWRFMTDLASRIDSRIQLTSDGLRAYIDAVDAAFDGHVDYALLVKLYGEAPGGVKGRYSPAECTGAVKTPILGNPAEEHISTSFVERQNLTMRMHVRRMTRLTNAFSKKFEAHANAVALHFVYTISAASIRR